MVQNFHCSPRDQCCEILQVKRHWEHIKQNGSTSIKIAYDEWKIPCKEHSVFWSQQRWGKYCFQPVSLQVERVKGSPVERRHMFIYQQDTFIQSLTPCSTLSVGKFTKGSHRSSDSPSMFSVILPSYFLCIRLQASSATDLPENPGSLCSISLMNDRWCVKHTWVTFSTEHRSYFAVESTHCFCLFSFWLNNRALSLSKHSAALDKTQTAQRRAQHLLLHWHWWGKKIIFINSFTQMCLHKNWMNIFLIQMMLCSIKTIYHRVCCTILVLVVQVTLSIVRMH